MYNAAYISFDHMEFYFPFRQPIAFPDFGQLYGYCQGEESKSSTIISGNIKMHPTMSFVSILGVVFINEVVLIFEVVLMFEVVFINEVALILEVVLMFEGMFIKQVTLIFEVILIFGIVFIFEVVLILKGHLPF